MSLVSLEVDTLSALYLHNLGCLYRVRFDRLGQLDDVNHAISLHCQAISHAGELKGNLPEFYAGLGEAYEARYGRLANLDDIQSAIYTHQHSIFLAQKYGQEEARFLRNLGGSYRHRFCRLGNVADAEKAIDYFLEAVELASNDELEKAVCLSELAVAYRMRYEQLGTLGDIDESISWHSQALSQLPDSHPLRPSFMFRLGQALDGRADYSGKIEDIDNAITCHLTALSLMSDNDEHRINLLDSGLGWAYESRFERLGDRSDIDKSIAHRMAAIQMTPEDHPHLPARLMGLSSSYISRYQRLGERRDIDEAIGLQLRAISIIPDDHASKPSFLDNLGIAYMRRFEHGHDESDLDQAISSQLQSIALQFHEGLELTLALSNVCGSYLRRFRLHGKLDDIDRAIEAGVRARALIPAENVTQLQVQSNNLGNAYKLRFGSLENPNDLNMSIEAYSTAALAPTGHPSFRYHAAREWAKLSTLHEMPSALDAHQRVMELLSQVVWLGTSVQHRYRDIPSLGDSVTEAVVTAIEQENYELALEWFEQGRSIVWKQMLQLRTPLAQLRGTKPDLADRIESVGRALDRAMKPQSVGVAMDANVSSTERSAQRHRQLAQDWDNLMDEAHSVLGEANPYLPRKAASLVHAARTGPVIAINIHEDRCDALVLKPGSARVAYVPLPSLSREKVEEASEGLALLLHRTGVPVPQKRSPVFYHSNDLHGSFKEILCFLWLDIVEPIVEYLAYKPQANTDTLPHVTWCTTGPLAFLPIHAAGLFDEKDSTSKAYNHMVSSYTPTLSALLPSSKPNSDFHGILTVGQANLGTLNALPATVEELGIISKHARGISLTQLDDNRATPDTVLRAMRTHSWVHLACHAHQNAADPTKSCFQLHSETLDLARITEEPLEHAVFAFLSACQTASGDKDLPDEAVHLAAGMLMAGYQTVIATMWSINDKDAPLVTDKVYGHLLEGGIPDATRAARALHIAVEALRDKIGEEDFSAWVPFIHMGL
ncbi:hypothetical protein FRC06_001465 [Ceratobasidium sp. 370]|nr:hypothetical protein FRC06_001465 [Ceratobasidium sp. 370]